ncbi:MAG: hypothetical protein AzoDbin1_02140 [Azoarcus sp.]|nr:hypothetical protein [Azoarcus sp.]
MTFSGNHFEHWERAVLRGETTSTPWVALRNVQFKRPTETESKSALEEWAAAHGVKLVWKDTISPNRTLVQEIHFLLER